MFHEESGTPYWEFGKGDLKDVYLEDSYLLGLDEGPRGVVFRMELVLRESHPAYRPPLPAEQYCYRRGQLLFANPTGVHWNQSTFRPISDATGEVDFGNIDALIETRPGTYLIEGEWGSVLITSDPPKVVIGPGDAASQARTDNQGS